MCQEAVTAVLAISRIGAIYTPCFSGYGAQAVATRLQDCDAKVLITADAFTRRGHLIPMKQTADEAVTEGCAFIL
jgi:acetyl-CoA synthetase